MILTIAGILGSLATIAGAGYGVLKLLNWMFGQTPAQTDAQIDKANQDAKHKAEETGRPV